MAKSHASFHLFVFKLVNTIQRIIIYKNLYFFFVWRAVLSLSKIHQKLYIWNYILQGVTTLWYNIHLWSYAVSYNNCLIANMFAHLTAKLQNFCRVWYAGSPILNICIYETRQYYRNAYLREIWNCFFHAQAFFRSQSLYTNWPKSKKKNQKQAKTKNKTTVGICTKTVCHFDDGFCHT